MNVIYLICTSVLSAIGVALTIPRLIRYFRKTSSLDVPNHRSAHKIPIPTMGGLSFFIGLIVAVCISGSFEILIVSIFISLAGILGCWDDLKSIEPKLKFVFQALIATGLFWCGFSLAPLISKMVNIDIPFYIDWILTVFFMLGVINAFNLIDGVDGLLIGLTLISSVILTFIFFLHGQWAFLYLTSSMIGVSLSFLFYNFQPAKIFMGDTGSLFIGVYISVSILKIADIGNPKFSILALSLVLFACVDMLRLFLGRYLILKKPFIADRNHFHHILMKIGWSHRKIVLHAYAFQVSLSILSLFLSMKLTLLNNLLVLVFFCIASYSLLQLVVFRKLQLIWKKTRRQRNEKIGDNELLKTYLK